eukprot:CAMPEP_0198448370 /NCGR_PEP_ID=MMETSP1453-20131121/3358_1 /TAXON_ID=1461543 ORGANISM="Unidentified sp., Strain RCC701" /NCGR_SAMPLE_ID=MMETSP1453 /ASSEMBLY_ACC=CAM_ASM_001118 /LENGTH=63 /DNA_ID=CAMNT_0044170765 /DNA_START=141 /DNA_END=331 /DNA_ORIENTATION=-
MSEQQHATIASDDTAPPRRGEGGTWGEAGEPSTGCASWAHGEPLDVLRRMERLPAVEELARSG